ncbi:GTP-binding protein [Actinomadura kijaniata]|uniref:GTP-binding protein n=1 Tax=Actinomadura kijaniata TaxID=46161 RepID=UPI003F535F32
MAYLPHDVDRIGKILVVGGFGVGKTTLVSSVSDIPPLHTEELMTNASVGVDEVGGVPGKTTTTVALDFGRLTLSAASAADPDDPGRNQHDQQDGRDGPGARGGAAGGVASGVAGGVVLYVFGAPGQRRFWDLWHGLVDGAIGLLVLADLRDLEPTFEVLDQLDRMGTGPSQVPLTVAINCWPDTPTCYTEPDIRDALALPAAVPLVTCKAVDRRSSIQALRVLTAHAVATHPDHEQGAHRGLHQGDGHSIAPALDFTFLSASAAVPDQAGREAATPRKGPDAAKH